MGRLSSPTPGGHRHLEPEPAQSTEIEQLRLAAEQGDADAQYNLGLGLMYDNGQAPLTKEATRFALWTLILPTTSPRSRRIHP